MAIPCRDAVIPAAAQKFSVGPFQGDGNERTNAAVRIARCCGEAKRQRLAKV